MDQFSKLSAPPVIGSTSGLRCRYDCEDPSTKTTWKVMPKPPEQTFDFRGKPKPLVAQFKDLQDACEVRNTHELTVHGAVWKSSVVTKTFVFGVTSIKKTGPRRRTRTEP